MKPIFFIVALLLCLSCADEDKKNPVIDPSYVYFQVAEITPTHGDSYILPLKDPAAIAQARELIQSGQTQIVVAEISKDENENYSINKDLKNNRVWSWHVSGFLGFADNTIEIYDGWPEYVEENYDEWVEITKGENGKGRIGFWNYTVVREISAAELQ
jgi:hypothetical protein